MYPLDLVLIGRAALGNREPAFIARAAAEDEVKGLILVGCRSEEHTSELQSHVNLVCRLLLEKKKKSAKLVEILHAGNNYVIIVVLLRPQRSPTHHPSHSHLLSQQCTPACIVAPFPLSSSARV